MFRPASRTRCGDRLIPEAQVQARRDAEREARVQQLDAAARLVAGLAAHKD